MTLSWMMNEPERNLWLVRVRAGLAIVLAVGVFWLVGDLAGITPVPFYCGSVLAQANPVTGLLAVAILMVGLCMVAHLLVSPLAVIDDRGLDSALLVACIGLAALGARAGGARPVYFASNGRGIFITLAVETVMLAGILALCAWVLTFFAKVGSSGANEAGATSNPVYIRLLTTLTQAAVMTACMMFLAQSEAKKQAMAAVAVSSAIGSMAAYFTFPQRASCWYWAGPLLVGIAGYAMAYAGPAGLAIGFPQGALGALARAMPLDYASVGVAGAIAGHWMAYNWAHQVDEYEEEPDLEAKPVAGAQSASA